MPLELSAVHGVDWSSTTAEEPMYLARFSYDVAPANRERALESIPARKKGLDACILVPLTRAMAGQPCSSRSR